MRFVVDCAGLRGWTVRRRRLHGKKNIPSLFDTRSLFNMTDHMINNTSDQNNVFLDILSDVMNRANGFDADVMIPVDQKGTEAILKESNLACLVFYLMRKLSTFTQPHRDPR